MRARSGLLRGIMLSGSLRTVVDAERGRSHRCQAVEPTHPFPLPSLSTKGLDVARLFGPWRRQFACPPLGSGGYEDSLKSAKSLFLAAVVCLQVGLSCAVAVGQDAAAPEKQSAQSQLEPGASAPSAAIRVIRLQHLEAEDAAKTLTLFFGEKLKIASDAKTNSVILAGTEQEFELASKLLNDLDISATRRPENGWPASATQTAETQVDTLRKEFQDLESACLELAKILRSPSEDGEPAERIAKTEQLTSLVRQAFELRQRLQRAEVAVQLQRLEKIEKNIEARDKLASKIVERRVAELLDPSVNWLVANAPATTTQSPENPITKLPSATENASEKASTVTKLDPLQAPTPRPSNLPSGVSESKLLAKSPQEIRKLISEARDFYTTAQQRLERAEKELKTQGASELLTERVRSCQQSLAYVKREYDFVMLEYAEIMKYLQSASTITAEQLAAAVKAYELADIAWKKGAVSSTEVNTANVRAQELKLELQRIESLGKLYRAAGEFE